MAKRQSQRKGGKPRSRYYTDGLDGPAVLPPNLGRGANIRIITPEGDVVQSNPSEYKKLGSAQKSAIVGGICTALGIPTVVA